MAHYLLFLPGKTDAKRSDLDGFGLSSLLDETDSDPHFFPVAGTGGPDGGEGSIVQLKKELDPEKQHHNPAAGYLPHCQTWRKSLDGRYWLGWETDNPPTEAELARNQQLDGRRCVLGNGEPWLIPNTFAQRARMKKDTEGKWQASSEYIHDELQAKAAPMMVMLEHAIEREYQVSQAEDEEALEQIPEDTWNDDAALDFVADLLSINYRVNDFIIGELGLLVLDRVPQIVGMATDYARLVQLERELRSGKSPVRTS